VVGGNAVGAWIEQVDEAAVRATQDVDLAIRRVDLQAAKTALESRGFIYRHVAGVDKFLDGKEATPRDAVHIVFSGEKVRPQYVAPVPDVTETESFKAYRVLKLESLVRMKLTSFRLKDRVHLLDMIGVDLIDSTWVGKFAPELATRLQELLDNPDG
jgi:hypothetical protein